MFTIGDVVDESIRAANQQVKPVPAPQAVWAPASFLAEQKVEGWSDMPVWSDAKGTEAAFAKTSAERAMKAGLRITPMRNTVADTLAWHLKRPAAEREKLKAGIAPEREKRGARGVEGLTAPAPEPVTQLRMATKSPSKRSHVATLERQMRSHGHARATASLQRANETIPRGLVDARSDGCEVAADRLVIVHDVPLDHRRRLHVRMQQPDVHQGPRGERGDSRRTAPEQGLVMIDVRRQRRSELDAPGRRDLHPNTHGRR